MSDLETLRTMLGEAFPIVTDDDVGELHFVEVSPDDEELNVTVRLVRFDVHDDHKTIRDVKEQQVVFGRLEQLEYPERIREYLGALARVFAQMSPEVIETAMPADFFHPDVLDLRIRAGDEFYEALTVESRLGGLMDDDG